MDRYNQQRQPSGLGTLSSSQGIGTNYFQQSLGGTQFGQTTGQGDFRGQPGQTNFGQTNLGQTGMTQTQLSNFNTTGFQQTGGPYTQTGFQQTGTPGLTQTGFQQTGANLQNSTRQTNQPPIKNSSQQVNPNTLIEDEYVHNLQQQIYFLELEAKLLKEKEEEQSGAFMFEGLQNIPVSENIWALKQKYSLMQRELDKRIRELDIENYQITIRFQALQMNLDRLLQEKAEIEDRTRSQMEFYDVELQKYRKTLQQITSQRNESDKHYEEINKERVISKGMNHDLQMNYEKQASAVEETNNRSRVLEQYRNAIVDEKNGQIGQLQDELRRLEQQVANNTTLQGLEEQLDRMMKRQREIELEKDQLVHRCNALEYAKDLIDKSTQQLSIDKRQMTARIDELEKEVEKEQRHLEALLTKNLKDRENKDLERALRGINEANKELQYQLEQYKQKQLESVRLIDARRDLLHDYESANEEFTRLQQSLHDTETHVTSIERELENTDYRVKDLEERNRQLMSEFQKQRSANEELFSHNAELKSRVGYLEGLLKRNDIIGNIDVNELRSLMTSNVEVNDTLNQLVDRWGGIQEFQKSQRG